MKNLSERTKGLIAESRWIAEKLDNDFVGLDHFFLGYNKFRDPAGFDFKVTISEKKLLIRHIKGVKLNGIFDDNYSITKEYESALLNSTFHKWIFSDKQVDPKHVYLSGLCMDLNAKDKYLNILKENQIEISRLRKLMIDIYFNKFLRQTGLAAVVRIF